MRDRGVLSARGQERASRRFPSPSALDHPRSTRPARRPNLPASSRILLVRAPWLWRPHRMHAALHTPGSTTTPPPPNQPPLPPSGFRIDALLTPQGHDTAFDSSLFRTRTRAEVSRALRRFFPRQAHCTHGAHPRLVAAAAMRRVRELECALRQSEVFATHELIGTTLLLVADETGRFGAWMIDFGVTLGGVRLKHDVPWVEGNREDGYLIGVRNLIVLLERIVQEDEWD